MNVGMVSPALSQWKSEQGAKLTLYYLLKTIHHNKESLEKRLGSGSHALAPLTMLSLFHRYLQSRA